MMPWWCYLGGSLRARFVNGMCKNQPASKQPYWNIDEHAFFWNCFQNYILFFKILNPTKGFATGKKLIYMYLYIITYYLYICIYINIPPTLTNLCFGLVISNTSLVVKGRCVLPFGARSSPWWSSEFVGKIWLVNSHQRRMMVGWTKMLSLTRCDSISMRELKMYWMYFATISLTAGLCLIVGIPRTLWTCGEAWLDDLKFKGWVKGVIFAENCTALP